MEYDTLLSVVLTKHQIDVMCILSNGGVIHSFSDGTIAFEDFEANTIEFRKDTFKKLLKHKLIEHTKTPALGVEIYEISERGHLFLVVE